MRIHELVQFDNITGEAKAEDLTRTSRPDDLLGVQKPEMVATGGEEDLVDMENHAFVDDVRHSSVAYMLV
jgi:hypothetical protein